MRIVDTCILGTIEYWRSDCQRGRKANDAPVAKGMRATFASRKVASRTGSIASASRPIKVHEFSVVRCNFVVLLLTSNFASDRLEQSELFNRIIASHDACFPQLALPDAIGIKRKRGVPLAYIK